MSARNLAITLEYDGTHFAGWQCQPGQRTVQSELEKAFAALTGEKRRSVPASRTDSGVHARGQVVHLRCSTTMPVHRLRLGLNHILPEDVAVSDIRDMPEAFHARCNAKGKWYRYVVYDNPARPVLDRHRVYSMRRGLSLRAMRAAAGHMVGRHDFRSFGVSSGRKREHTQKTIHVLSVRKRDSEIIVDIVGNSFLYRMARSMVGTLLDVGLGRRKASDIPAIFAHKDRKKAGLSAHAKGLCLMRVYYDEPPRHVNRLK